MNALQSLLLGALQGLTEFLPVSSSGHLLLARRLLGLGEIPVLFDVLLHMSTLAVVVVVFRRRLGAVFAALGRWLARRARPEDGEELRLALYIVLATVVTAAIGLVFDRLEESILARPRLLSAFFLFTGLFLLSTLAFRGDRDYRRLGWLRALAVGAAQGIGVLPGVSRSGITITAALACGLEREKAGEFAFLLSLPSVLGALLLKLREAGSLAQSVPPLTLAAGMLASFAVGLAALWLLLRLIRRGRLAWFSAYLLPLSAASFFLL